MKQLFLLLISTFTASTAFTQWVTSPSNNMYNTNSGAVGIGTTVPSGPLFIKTSSDNIINFQTSDNLWLYSQWPDNGGVRKTWMGLNDNLSSFHINVENGANKILFNGGNVGINTGTPLATLDVQGTLRLGNVNTPAGYRLYVEQGILAEKVKVAIKTSANWSDYVFDKGYQLKSLPEVEAYINKNKHLPGIPSGETLVKEGGIDVNQMFAKQMEKIEELTLYVIQQGKEIAQLKKENMQQRKRIDRLQRKH
jgi:trimeric autotransporter adhesin